MKENSDNIRILLIRHGESKGNVNDNAYVKYGDAHVPLTDKGWSQAIDAGIFLRSYYQGKKQLPRIYTSSYRRAIETLSGVVKTTGIPPHPDDRVIYEDSRLIERSFGLLPHFNNNDQQSDDYEITEILHRYSQELHKKSPFIAQPIGGLSPQELCTDIKSFIDGTLMRDISGDNVRDCLISTHGAVIRAFIKEWFHVPMTQWGDIPRPGNCDIIAITGRPQKWNVEKIYDGEQRKAVEINPLRNIDYLTFDTLPDIPKHLRPD